MLSDFNCKIFNYDHIKLLNTTDNFSDVIAEKIKSDLSVLDLLGIHRLICQVTCDENKPVSLTLEKIKNLESFIKASIPGSLRRKFNVSVYPSVALSENTPYVQKLSELTVKGTNYIFAELPISIVYPDYLDATINKILYNCKLRPIFTEFDIFATIHKSTDYIEKMINIKGAAFVFSLNNKNFQNNIDLIKAIYAKGNKVLFSTNSEHDVFNAKRIADNVAFLKEKLQKGAYLDIMLQAHSFLR